MHGTNVLTPYREGSEEGATSIGVQRAAAAAAQKNNFDNIVPDTLYEIGRCRIVDLQLKNKNSTI